MKSNGGVLFPTQTCRKIIKFNGQFHGVIELTKHLYLGIKQ